VQPEGNTGSIHIGEGFDDGIGPSGIFLLPTRKDSDSLRNLRPRTNRLAVWIAIGLGMMSAMGGIVYYLHYHQIGNRITEILPRDTVAYAVAGQPRSLEESILSLNRWETSRPIRNRLTDRQQAFVRAKLLDMGLSSSALMDLKEGAREIHVAILAEPSRAPTVSPYDTLIFLGFDEEEVREQLVGRMEPFFERVGSEAGIDIAVRRTPTGHVALATFEDYVVLCLGGDATLRRVLRNRKRGPVHSLNDDVGFRTAYRSRERQATFWSYVRYDHALNFGLTRWVYPHLTPHQQREFNVHRHLFSPDLLGSMSIHSRIEHGEEQSMVRFYPNSEADLSSATTHMGQQEKRTLRAVPQDTLLAIALTVQQPEALLEQWSQPLLRAMKDLQLIDLANEVDALSHQLSTNSSVQIKADIWDNLDHELTIAWVPDPADASPQPLLILPVRDTIKAHKTTMMLAQEVLRPLPFFAGASPTVVETKDGGYIRIGPESSKSEGLTPPNKANVLLCWRTSEGYWMASRRCGVVERSIQTLHSDNGLDTQTLIKTVLAGEQAANTAFIAVRPAALMNWLESDQAPLVRDDFWATASIHVAPDTVSVFSNVSPLSVATHQAMQEQSPGSAADPNTAGEADPCQQLIAAVCDSLHDPSHCPKWKEKVRNTPTTACETGLRTLAALEGHPL